jgi:integrase
MATIRKRVAKDGTVSWQAQVRRRGKIPATATFGRKSDATAWGITTEDAIKRDRYFPEAEARRHTLAEAIDLHRERVQPTKRDKRGLAQRVSRWQEQLGDRLLGDVTPATVAQCRDKLVSEGRTGATANRYLMALSSVLAYVSTPEVAWLESNPVHRVRKNPESRGRVRFLSEDERKRLLAECRKSPSPNLYLAVVLSLATGARQSEIMNLRWGDVDLERGIATLHETKNGERRALHLAGHALELLKRRAKVRYLHSDLVFAREREDRPVVLQNPWQRALRRAKITDFRWHDLRHSAASYLAMNGATLAEIADVLGHRTLQMVKRYAHLSEEHSGGVVARMNARIFSAT